MEDYKREIAYKMREIYKTILERIVHTGETQESDILFIKLYKNEFESLACKMMIGD